MSEDKPTNVLSFPKRQPVNLADTKSKEEFVQKLGEQKEQYIDMVLARNMNQLYNRMAAEGFNIEDDAFFRDFCFVVEALKAAMLRQCGLEHQLHKFVEENFEVTPSDDDENPDDEDGDE